MSCSKVPLRRLFQVVNGGTPTAEPANWDGDVPWATPIDLGRHHGGYITETARTLTPAGLVAGSRAVPPGSLVVSTRAPIGYVAHAKVKLALNQGCRGLVPRRPMEARFYRYALTTLTKHLESLGQGSTFLELSSDALASLHVPMPSVAQQRSVADFLDAETARIDALVARRARTMQLVDERISSKLNQIIGTDQVVGADGIPHAVGPHPCVRLGHLAAIQTGLTLDAQRRVDEESVSMPYLRVANVQDGRLDLMEVKDVKVPPALASRSRLRAGDVLMTEGGDPDKLGRGTVWTGRIDPCIHQNHIFAVRPTADLLPAFLALVTRTNYARRYFEVTATKTTGIASTNTAKISAFPVPLPEVAEQQRLVEQYEQEMSVHGRLQDALREQVALLREHRQALITAAVTGALEVPEVAA